MADRHAALLFKIYFAWGEVYPWEHTPQGTRRSALVTGGTFTGPTLQGTVLPGGGDWLLIRPDGACELDVRVTLQTDDGHRISMSYRSI
jgi:Protein of unknown function (DUF3237)